MDIAVFGGTFNPVHNGHTRLLREVCARFDLGKVLVIPAKTPPHKQAHDLASEQDRLTMCRMAFAEFENAEISDIELRHEGKSYSVLTLRRLKALYPADKLYFIMGSDMLLSFEQWYCYREILSLAALICISRSREDTAALEPYAEKLRAQGGEVHILECEPLELSSTEIRTLIYKKKFTKLSCYLNENVVKYIMDKNLYDWAE